jgi:hypothetical protein
MKKLDYLLTLYSYMKNNNNFKLWYNNGKNLLCDIANILFCLNDVSLLKQTNIQKPNTTIPSTGINTNNKDNHLNSLGINVIVSSLSIYLA